MALCTDLRCYNKYGGSDTTNPCSLRFSLFCYSSLSPCGAVYPRNTSQCPHEDGGANAQTGGEANRIRRGEFLNCAHRGALSLSAERTHGCLHTACRKRSPKPGFNPSAHSIPPTIRAAKNCAGKSGARGRGGAQSKQRKNTCAVSASIISPPTLP